jgi:hypothetical protein
MFPPGVRGNVSRNISNEFRCSFRLNSLLILLLTSLLTAGGNIPLGITKLPSFAKQEQKLKNSTPFSMTSKPVLESASKEKSMLL